MKRYILIFSALCISAAASAQTMLDAIRFGTDSYFGTARSMAMGNAMTAVGGDLGSVGINPAGGTVAGYSQFTVSPGIDIAVGRGAYAPGYSDNPSFGGDSRSSNTTFMMPNIGAMFVFNVGNGSGLRSFSFGILSNNTDVYNDVNVASGVDSNTSLTGSRAYWATMNANGYGGMLPPNCLSNVGNAFAGNYWNLVAAYDGGLINYSMPSDCYFGSAEQEQPGVPGSYGIPGTLRHVMSTRSSGAKNDLVLNFAMNFDNCLYIGLNIGIPMARYNYSECLSETAEIPSDFPVVPSYIDNKGVYVQGAPTNYRGSKYEYVYSTQVTGIYGKLGVIWLPNDNLRLGAAVRTPVGYSVSQTYGVSNSSYFTDSSQNGNSYCDSDRESFRLRGPFEANFGIACTFGRFGMLSFDYELTDFHTMQYSNYNRNAADPSLYDDVNRLTDIFCGLGHQFRVGAEVNILPCLAVRAGFNLITNPERSYKVGDQEIRASNYDLFSHIYPSRSSLGKAYYDSKKNVFSLSAGLGYQSRGSFFADLGVRRTAYPEAVYSLYSTYVYNNDGSVKYFAPEEKLARKLWDITLTLGWRF